uniref:Reverse transcriptase domain-containing protein n=1 Tax=Caenorhabditis tropicalis TaxID=1561998 RepID=A0A1I7U7S5_9PELO
MRAAREVSKRKSTDIVRENVVYKRPKSMSKEGSPIMEENLTPDVVISNLQDIVNNALLNEELPEAAIIELKGFDASATTMEEYMQKREEIRRMVGDSEFFDRKTELNLGVASLAGAQLEIDKRVTTRRMSRKIHDECGINEKDILYKGLDYHGTEVQASRELRSSRQASIIESCVDFQKQMQWKIGIMDQVKAKSNPLGKTYPMSDGPSIRTRGGQDKQREEMRKQKKEQEKCRKIKNDDNPFKTPQKKLEFNALDERRIIENYQLEVASEVRTHRPTVTRSIAPIPYDINILDDESSDDEAMEF